MVKRSFTQSVNSLLYSCCLSSINFFFILVAHSKRKFLVLAEIECDKLITLRNNLTADLFNLMKIQLFFPGLSHTHKKERERINNKKKNGSNIISLVRG